MTPEALGLVQTAVHYTLHFLAPGLIAWLFDSGWLLGALFVISFLLRSFYFTFFELRWKGATPGKRSLGLRVIDAHGGALSSDAVLVRNLTREVEVFLPLAALFQAEQLTSQQGVVVESQ